MDSLCNIFLWFMESTLAASVIMLLIMAVQKFFRQHISAHMLHILWLIVLVRLLVPVFPNSPVSIFHLFQLAPEMTQVAMTNSSYTENQLTQQLVVDNQARLFPRNITYGLLLGNQPISENISSLETENEVALPVYTYSVSLQIISVLWLTGVVALILHLIVSLLKMRRKRNVYKLVTDPQIVSVINHCREKFGIKKSIPVYMGSTEKSPYISGLLYPWIYIPRGLSKELSHNQLIHIFSHELAHLKRRDMAWNLLGSFVLALHWLNPLVWICMKQMKADREIACDAYTLEILGESEAVPYGMTILECLKNLSSKRGMPGLLTFYETNNQKQMERRIRMIKFFKKGSYKLSTLAIIGIFTLGIVTLTNAGPPTTTESNPKNVEERVLFDSPIRMYGTLEKGVKVANFRFKVPETLPDGFRFEQIAYYRENYPKGAVSIAFEKREGNRSPSYGSIDLTAIVDGVEFEEVIYSDMERAEREHGAKIRKETFNEHGVSGIKVTVSKNNWEKFHYLWQDENILYVIENRNHADLTHQDMVAMIASMKYPNKKMFERDANDDRLVEYIYDTGDLQQVPESIGFQPKFPLQLPGGYQAGGAMETRKVNFSHPDDEADQWTRLFYITYTKTEQNELERSSFSFKQIKNNHLYEDMKESGMIAYSRIDGKPHGVKVKPTEIEGKEVLVTENYKIDGALSSSSEPDYTSYFWKENDICFQVTFKADNPEKEDIVSYLMNEKFVDVNNLN